MFRLYLTKKLPRYGVVTKYRKLLERDMVNLRHHGLDMIIGKSVFEYNSTHDYHTYKKLPHIVNLIKH